MIIPEACDAAITGSQDVLCSHMTHEKHNNNQSLVDKLIAAILRLPWTDVLGGFSELPPLANGQSAPLEAPWPATTARSL
jgi:hypothetical protein